MNDILPPRRPAAKPVFLDTPPKPQESEKIQPEDPSSAPDIDLAPEENKETDTTPSSDETPKTEDVTPKRRWLFFKHTKLTKKQWIIVGGVLVVLVAAGAFFGYHLYNNSRKANVADNTIKGQKTPPKPKTEASHLTGIQVDSALNKRPVTGFMIENSQDARPQSGLKDAGIVYEAIAEGGITRFLALFQEAQPSYIGPVRSVRPYYLDFLMPFDASIAHVGGAPQALSDIKSLSVKDLDQFANGGSYQRISSRIAPHNVYTSMQAIDALNQKKGFNSSSFTSFPRKKDEPSKQPTAKVIDFSISSALFNVHYDYDAAANSYKRSEGGAPHMDEKSNTQLEPKVVLALVMSRGIDADGQHTDYTTSGSGDMFVFQDGTEVKGTWKKADRKSQFTFNDAAGAPLKLNAGQTWISIVDGDSSVTFTP